MLSDGSAAVSSAGFDGLVSGVEGSKDGLGLAVAGASMRMTSLAVLVEDGAGRWTLGVLSWRKGPLCPGGGGGSATVGGASVSGRWGGISQGGGASVPGREDRPASTEASAPIVEWVRAVSVRGPLVLVAGDRDLTRIRR